MEDTIIQDVLKTVQNYYEKNDYEGALKVLKDNPSQVSPGVWHFNVGTLYAKLENFPMARYHLLEANRNGFYSKESSINTDIIETKLDIQKYEEPISFSDYLIKGSVILSSSILISIGFVFLILSLGIQFKKLSRKLGIILFVFSLIIFGLHFWIESWNRYLVVSPQVLQDGPSVIFNSREELPKGLIFIGHPKEDWVEIKYPSRFKGWIKNSGLQEFQ